MPKARSQTLTTVIEQLCLITLTWTSDSKNTTLGAYVIRHGVPHLLAQNRNLEAEDRMLDLSYMAAFYSSYQTVIEPLMAWRLVGLERAKEGFTQLAIALPDILTCTKEDASTVAIVSTFLEVAGMYEPGVIMAKWSLALREHCNGADDKSTLSSIAILSSIISKTREVCRSRVIVYS